MPSITDAINQKYGVSGDNIADAISKVYDSGQTVENLFSRVMSAIEEKGAETLASIPNDYTALSNQVDGVEDTLDSYVYQDANNLFCGKTIYYHKTVNSNGETADSDTYDYIEIEVTQGTTYKFHPSPRFLRLKVNGSVVDNQANLDTYTPSYSGTLYCILYDSLIDQYKCYLNGYDGTGILPIGKKKLDTSITAYSVTLSSFVKPQDFGAIGDGVTDDTAAFQKAIESAYNKVLLVPYGKYLISSPLSIEEPICILGTQSIIKNYTVNGTSHAPESYITTSSSINAIFVISSTNVTIRDIAIDANSKASYGLYSDDTNSISRINLENVHVKNAINDGFHLCMYLSSFRLCTAFNCGRRGFSLGSSTGANMTSVSIQSCYADACPTGFYITHFVYSAMFSCAADNSTDAYVIISSSITIQSCGCERAANPMYIQAGRYITLIDFYAVNVKNKNNQNTNGAIIKTYGLTYNMVISGVRFHQLDEDDSRGVETYKMYKLRLAADRLDQVTILDDSIKYAEIFLDTAKFPNKYPVSFPHKRSVINNLLTLSTGSNQEVSCEKLHNGEYLLTVTEVNQQALTRVFPCAVVTLDPGLYVVKGTEGTSETLNYGISVATESYGNGEIAVDGGETDSFELEEQTKVYVALKMKPNELRTVRFIPEIIKID